MRSSVEITQQEQDTIRQFVIENGLVDSEDNGKLLGDFVLRMNVDITNAVLKAALPYVRNQLKFKSAPQIELEQLVTQFTPAQRDAVYGWFAKQNLLVIEGEEGIKNIIAVLREVSPAREFTNSNIEAAIGRISYSGRGQLYYKQAPKVEHPTHRAGRFNHASQKEEQQPKVDGPQYRGGRLNHASVQQQKKSELPSAPMDAWASICEKLTRNGTHGQQNRLRQILDGAIGDGKSYREAHSLLEAELRAMQRG